MSELLDKAQRALSSAVILLEAGDNDGACNRAYYAMFDAARAALTEGDDPLVVEQARTHNGLIAQFGLNLVKPGLVSGDLGRAFNRVEELRLIADYKTGEAITEDKARWAVSTSEDFVETMVDLIDQSSAPLPSV